MWTLPLECVQICVYYNLTRIPITSRYWCQCECGLTVWALSVTVFVWIVINYCMPMSSSVIKRVCLCVMSLLRVCVSCHCWLLTDDVSCCCCCCGNRLMQLVPVCHSVSLVPASIVNLLLLLLLLLLLVISTVIRIDSLVTPPSFSSCVVCRCFDAVLLNARISVLIVVKIAACLCEPRCWRFH